MQQLSTNSRLSNLIKIIEKLIHARLTLFLNSNSILFEKQFGFRHSHSTTHTLIWVIWDAGQYACGVFLDLQKAFNTVSHDILLRKLNQRHNKQLVSFLLARQNVIYQCQQLPIQHETIEIWCAKRIRCRPSSLYFVH